MSFYNDVLRLAARRASEQFGRKISVESVRTAHKSPFYSEPRFFVMAYMRATGQYSMPQIARALRLKDHSTVLHGLRRAHGHDGKLIHKHEPLWTKEQFQNMAFADGVMQRLPPQAYERVNCEQIMAIGLSNLRRAVRRIPKRWTPNHVEEAA